MSNQKVCPKCNGVMSFDGYFNSLICSRCGKMERLRKYCKECDSIMKSISNSVEITNHRDDGGFEAECKNLDLSFLKEEGNKQ